VSQLSKICSYLNAFGRSFSVQREINQTLPFVATENIHFYIYFQRDPAAGNAWKNGANLQKLWSDDSIQAAFTRHRCSLNCSNTPL
jgi:hypothetical protein